MNKSLARAAVRLLVTIVDRGQGNRVVDVFRNRQVYLQFVCLGHGTADSEILDYLGLGDTKKDLVLSLVPASAVQNLLDTIVHKMKLNYPGKGIAFTVPLSGISGLISQLVTKDQTMVEGGNNPMDSQGKYSLIVTVVNQGYTGEVMDAAKSAGATGGTVIPARGISNDEAEKFLGISLLAEKEVVAIIAPKENKQNIMQAIAQAAGLKTPARGIVLSLPVETIVGVN
ncbi:MAG: P-II family nitrogen regulator [Clostridia bacterium]|nr:P-II family nitrogen regulator [Clostridia bacterium]